MESIIEELLRIEEQAGQYLANAESKRKDSPAQVRRQSNDLKKTLDIKTREQIHRLTEESEELTRALLNEIATESRARMHRMEADFTENRNKWEEQLVRKILFSE